MIKKRLQRMSTRRKFFVSMLIFTLLSVIIVTTVAIVITYGTMKQQVIETHRMSAGWLQNRLELVTKKYSEKFYDFEVDESFKSDILSWFSVGENVNYSVKLRLISELNKTISMDSTINSIELHNLNDKSVIRAERSKALFLSDAGYIDAWKARDASKQTNLVFNREEKEISITHQMNRFSDNISLALVVIRIRPYEIQEILEDIKTNKDETILIFNEENQDIERVEGTTPVADEEIKRILERAGDKTTYEMTTSDAFWFYRSVNGGKLKIIQSVPNRTIISALNTTLYGGFFAAVLSILISLLFSLVLSHVISKPIISLAKEIRTIDLDNPKPQIVPNRQDEIGFLHDSFNIMVTRNRNLILKEYQSEINKKEAQLRALQAQINPHFMYNTLQVIGGMALKKDASEIYAITIALSDIMRYSLNYAKEMVVLKEEITYLNSYLSIQNERFANRIQFNLKISDAAMTAMVPKLILQPLVENCFEHGLFNKSGEWIITLEGEITDDGDLKIVVTDNGVGIGEEKIKEVNLILQKNAENAIKQGMHIGLCNVASRIKLQSDNPNHGVVMESALGKGTQITVLMKHVIGNEKNSRE
ncbi:sensor histidine kinase [Fusibacter bizertensis]